MMDDNHPSSQPTSVIEITDLGIVWLTEHWRSQTILIAITDREHIGHDPATWKSKLSRLLR
jgi:hypothetical protein